MQHEKCVLSSLVSIVDQFSHREGQNTPKPQAQSRLLVVVIQHCSLLTALFTVKLETALRCLLTIDVLHWSLYVNSLEQGLEPLFV